MTGGVEPEFSGMVLDAEDTRAEFRRRLRIAIHRFEESYDQDYTNAKLGEFLGYSGQRVGKWRTGDMPDEPAIQCLAQLLGQEPAWLRYGMGEMRVLPPRHGQKPQPVNQPAARISEDEARERLGLPSDASKPPRSAGDD